MAEFTINGPFDVPCERAKAGRKLLYREFWDTPGELQSLKGRYGVYVFGIRAGRGYKPLYVGKATKSYHQECFNQANRHKYLEALADQAKGTPVMFLVCHPVQKGRKNEKEIEQIETFLIQISAQKNPALQNVRKKTGPGWSIKGVIRGPRGKPTAAEREFKRAVGYERK